MDFMATAQLLGNFGEFVGAIAVVVTVAYLATQVRHSKDATEANTLANKALSNAQSQESMVATNELVAADPELAKLMSRVTEGAELDEFSDDERFRIILILRSITQRFESLFFRYQAGMLEEHVWVTRRTWLSGFLVLPTLARWWLDERRSSLYTDEFIDEIEKPADIRIGSAGLRVDSTP